MSDDRRPKLWHDAWKAAGLAMSFLDGVSFEEYLASTLVRSAAERQIMIVVEALNRAFALDAGLVQAIPDLHQLRGMRNHIVHQYDKTDHEMVYDAVSDEFPILRDRLAGLMRSVGWQDDNTLTPE